MGSGFSLLWWVLMTIHEYFVLISLSGNSKKLETPLFKHLFSLDFGGKDLIIIPQTLQIVVLIISVSHIFFWQLATGSG